MNYCSDVCGVLLLYWEARNFSGRMDFRPRKFWNEKN